MIGRARFPDLSMPTPAPKSRSGPALLLARRAHPLSRSAFGIVTHTPMIGRGRFPDLSMRTPAPNPCLVPIIIIIVPRFVYNPRPPKKMSRFLALVPTSTMDDAADRAAAANRDAALKRIFDRCLDECSQRELGVIAPPPSSAGELILGLVDAPISAVDSRCCFADDRDALRTAIVALGAMPWPVPLQQDASADALAAAFRTLVSDTLAGAYSEHDQLQAAVCQLVTTALVAEFIRPVATIALGVGVTSAMDAALGAATIADLG